MRARVNPLENPEKKPKTRIAALEVVSVLPQHGEEIIDQLTSSLILEKVVKLIM